MNKTKVGVIGVGHLGQHHVRIYRSLDTADLIGVHDIDHDKGKRIAAEHGCRFFPSASDLLSNLDVVSVAVPTTVHFRIAKEVLQSGVHLLIEKPITETTDEADELIKLANDKGLILQVGHVERFNPAVRNVKEFISQPMFIESHRLAPFNPRGTEVAVVLDLMIHDIDIVLSMICERIESIEAIGVPVLTDKEDIANARITFENGAVANLTASRVSREKVRKIRFFQKNSYISLDLAQKKAEIYVKKDVESNPQVLRALTPESILASFVDYKSIEDKEHDALELELGSFIDAVRNHTKPVVSGEQGREALRVALTIMDKIKLVKTKYLDAHLNGDI